jgi:hypothetical protein
MFRAYTVAPIMATGLAVAACGTDHAPTAPEMGSARSFRTESTHSSDRTDLWIG